MKKLAIMAILATAALAASAADISAVVKYDYDNASNAGTTVAANRSVVGLKYTLDGQLGAVDAGLANSRISLGNTTVNGVGYDVGYSNGVKLGAVGVNGRVGYTTYDIASIAGQHVSANAISYAAEVTYPLNSTFTAFAGVENLRGAVVAGPVTQYASANRYTIGTDIAVSKNTALRVGYARVDANGTGVVTNGLTTAFSYKF